MKNATPKKHGSKFNVHRLPLIDQACKGNDQCEERQKNCDSQVHVMLQMAKELRPKCDKTTKSLTISDQIVIAVTTYYPMAYDLHHLGYNLVVA